MGDASCGGVGMWHREIDYGYDWGGADKRCVEFWDVEECGWQAREEVKGKGDVILGFVYIVVNRGIIVVVMIWYF